MILIFLGYLEFCWCDVVNYVVKFRILVLVVFIGYLLFVCSWSVVEFICSK